MGLPSTTTTKGGTLVHPLFRRKKFRTKNGKAMIKAKDYDKVVRRPAVLASRLLDSPQALHFFYVTYFGKNLEMPCCNDHERCVSDKGINDLSLDDIKATRERLLLLVDRVQFEFADTKGNLGETRPLEQLPGERGCRSYIRLSTRLYSAAQNKDRGTIRNAQTDSIIAMTLLHELAHAAMNDVMGNYVEDCFEESFVAEAGFELESRLFGLILAANPSYEGNETFWYHWQTSWLLDVGYDRPDICCDRSKLGKRTLYRDLDSEFVLKLFDNRFWNGDYAKRGGVALLPPPVVNICQGRLSTWAEAYQAFPTSVKQLWLASEGIAYQQEKLPELANPTYEIRKQISELED